MTIEFTAAMREAAARVRAQDPLGATRLIQQALGGTPAADPAPAPAPEPVSGRPTRRRRSRIDPNAEDAEPMSSRPRRTLGAVVRALREGRLRTGLDMPQPSVPPPPVPDGARFEERSFAGAAGSRGYKLYIPACGPKAVMGLVVMLHGCKQNPDDFATGTGMNALAETHRLAVAYPRQGPGDNAGACWNWFEPGHQTRDRGEPAILAGLASALVDEFGLAPGQAMVAGLSAGGAMAALLGATHPEIFGAVGVHSGLAAGAARDLVSAFAAMRGDGPAPAATRRAHPRTIVFHGSADRTVHPVNAERILAAVRPEAPTTTRTLSDRSPGGRSYTRIVETGKGGTALLEDWRIDGAGHAWSGGNAAGSYTDPAGPDASAAMLRFFLDGRKNGA